MFYTGKKNKKFSFESGVNLESPLLTRGIKLLFFVPLTLLNLSENK